MCTRETAKYSTAFAIREYSYVCGSDSPAFVESIGWEIGDMNMSCRKMSLRNRQHRGAQLRKVYVITGRAPTPRRSQRHSTHSLVHPRCAGVHRVVTHRGESLLFDLLRPQVSFLPALHGHEVRGLPQPLARRMELLSLPAR